MAKSKFAFDFSEMQKLAETIKQMGGNITDAADEALNDTAKYITGNLAAAWPRHNRTGATGSAFMEHPSVKWERPGEAYVDIGFVMDAGGWPSIFVMWGTPKMRPDISLKNAAFGLGTVLHVREIQYQALQKYIERMGG